MHNDQRTSSVNPLAGPAPALGSLRALKELHSRHSPLDTQHSAAMSRFYRNFIRPALFSFDSEAIHHRMLSAAGWLGRHDALCDAMATCHAAAELPVELFGLKFSNPIGLAAGMDKYAAAVPVWEALGFGFVELGGVTWHPQAGNPAPRMFRAVADEALINRLGFNNPGAEAIAAKLTEW